MKNIFYLILFFIFNISYSSIDNNRIESYKYILTEKDSIIQSAELNYPYNITKNDSFKYPFNIQIELAVKDIRDLTLKKNYFWSSFDYALYSTRDTIYVTEQKDTINLEPANYVRPDYQEGDSKYWGYEYSEEIDINDSISIFQQLGYMENLFYHKWDLRNYPFDNQKLKISFITYEDTSIVRIDQAKHIKSSYNKNMQNLIDGYSITAIDHNKYFKKSPFKIKTKDGERFTINEVIDFHILVSRDGSFLYFKLFFGTFLSFLISYLVFFIDKKEFETRITLSVGGIFGAVGNRYFVESIMPEVQVLTKGDLINNLVILLIVMNIFIVIMQYNKNINWSFIRENKIPAIFSAFVFTILNLIIIYF